MSRAETAEWHVAKEIRLRALADAPSAFASTLAREQRFDDDEWRRRVGANAWFLAWTEARVVGVAVGIDDPDAVDARHLVGMWVEPAHRGRGVADDLVAAVTAWAVEDGAVALALWVVDHNPRARRFYERLGFVATGERGPLPSDPDVTESRMIRALDPQLG